MPTKLNPRDAKTMKRLKRTGRRRGRTWPAEKRDPYVDIPTRSLSNVKYNKSRRFIEMGSNTNRRQLFNLSQAKSYMQTMLVASGATQLIEQGKTTSIRGLFYLLKHTIEGTKEETFADQDECDPVIEDCEVLLNSLREELHLYAQKTRRHGGRYRAGRQRRRDRLRAHGLRRLRHPLDRRAGGDPVQEVRRRSSSCTSKKTRSGSGSTRTSSGASTSAFSPTAAASRRAACAGCCTACTTS